MGYMYDFFFFFFAKKFYCLKGLLYISIRIFGAVDCEMWLGSGGTSEGRYWSTEWITVYVVGGGYFE